MILARHSLPLISLLTRDTFSCSNVNTQEIIFCFEEASFSVVRGLPLIVSASLVSHNKNTQEHPRVQMYGLCNSFRENRIQRAQVTYCLCVLCVRACVCVCVCVCLRVCVLCVWLGGMSVSKSVFV